jgi:hypothetical protein
MDVFQQEIIFEIVPLVAIGLIHRQISTRGAFFLVLSNLPMTIMHELSHCIMALLLGGRPSGFSLWPRREGNRWRLGSVTARLTVISAVPTALAPLVWLLAGLVILNEKATIADGSLHLRAAVYLVVYLCVSASIPSWQDIKVALTHPLSLFIWVVMIAIVAFCIDSPITFPGVM